MAVRQINMIPANLLAKTILMRHLGFWGKGLISIFLFFAMAYLVQGYWLTKQVKSHPLNDSTTLDISEKIDQAFVAADTIKVQIQDLTQKSNLVATMANRQYYYDILAILAGSFNDATWIDQLTIQKEKDTDQSKILIQGFSLTHQTLGGFLESLSDNARVQDVVLVHAKKQTQDTFDLVLATAIQFELTCSITVGVSK